MKQVFMCVCLFNGSVVVCVGNFVTFALDSYESMRACGSLLLVDEISKYRFNSVTVVYLYFFQLLARLVS